MDAAVLVISPFDLTMIFTLSESFANDVRYCFSRPPISVTRSVIFWSLA